MRSIRGLSKLRALSRVDASDVQDFRLRVWRQLKRAPVEPADVARAAVLERASALEWTPIESLDPSLSQKPHVEKDKELLRGLLEYTISANKPKMWLEELYAGLKMGDSPSDCFQMLIDLGVVKPETNPCILRYDEPLLFSPEVLGEVGRLQARPEHDDDERTRVDLTQQAVLTIDAATATEIDDAVGLHVDARGRTWLHVHVADVVRLVRPKSPVDAFASRRAVSVFLPETHFPMLPQALSAASLSIVPGRATHTLTFAARLDDRGAVVERDVFPSRVQNVCKVSYNTADAVLAGSRPPGVQLSLQHEVALREISVLAIRRRAMREARGAVTTQVPEPEMRIRGKKVFVSREDRNQSPSRQLIEECMILGGQVAAEFARDNNVPIPYRVQSKREASRGAAAPLRRLAERSPEPQLLMALLEIEQHGAAFMDVAPGPHYSMGMEAYTQVTSPIRRYTDLMVAHQLKAHLRSHPLPFSSWDILNFRSQHETTVRRVEQLQNNSTRYWLLRHMSSDEFKAKNADGLAALVLSRPGASAMAMAGGNAHQVVKSTVSSYEQGDMISVFLMDLCFRGTFKLPAWRSVSVGDVVKLRVTKIDCMRLLVDFELM